MLRVTKGNDMATLNFLTSDGFTHTVNGQELKFYPITVLQLFQLRHISKTIAKNVQVLLGQSKQTVGSHFKQTSEGGKDGAFQIDDQKLPIDPKLHEQIHLHTQAAIDDLLDTLLHEDQQTLLVDIIFNSLRMPKLPNDSDKKKWLDNVDACSLMQFVTGLIGANKKMFDPLAQWAKTALNGLRNGKPEPVMSSGNTAPTGT